jgi:hypothetical protein
MAKQVKGDAARQREDQHKGKSNNKDGKRRGKRVAREKRFSICDMCTYFNDRCIFYIFCQKGTYFYRQILFYLPLFYNIFLPMPLVVALKPYPQTVSVSVSRARARNRNRNLTLNPASSKSNPNSNPIPIPMQVSSESIDI